MCIFGVFDLALLGVALHGGHESGLEAFLIHNTGSPAEALETRLGLASGDRHLEKVVGGDQVVEELP